MLGYVLDPGWYDQYWYSDPTGRVGTPHPAVGLAALILSVVLLGVMAFVQGA